jgi:hypothetical protein
MKKCHKSIISTLLLVMLFMLSLTTNDTFTFWASSISNAQDQANGQVTVGTWTFGPYSPDGISYYDSQTAYTTGDLIWFNGQIWEYNGSYTLDNEPSIQNNWTVYNDLNWYPEISYYTGDVILYNENIYVAEWQNTNQNPETTGINGPWENQNTDTLSWVTGQPSELNDIVYYDGTIWVYKGYYTTSEPGSQNDWQVKGDLTYSPNFVYANGDIVLYNGSYYITNNGGWATGSTPGTNAAWTLLTVPAFNGSVPNNSEYTTYNGLFYVALQGKVNGQDRNIVPGSAASKGIWQAINTQQWQQYNTYTNGDLVMYQGDVYELANSVNSSDIPGTTQNSWNGMATIYYNALNTYTLGEYVVYNGEVYVVVNETNANQGAPGTIQNAWNRLTGYDWYSYHVYQSGDVVFYNDAVYQASQQSLNETPDTNPSSWSLYEN